MCTVCTFPIAAWDPNQSSRSPATRSTTPKPAWGTTLNARKSDDALLAALVRAAGDPIYGQELTGTIQELAPGEVWITHGNEDALLRWCTLNNQAARALRLVGYDEDEGED